MDGNLIDILPPDYVTGLFLGRAQSPEGPCVLAIRSSELFDLTEVVATTSGAIDRRAFGSGPGGSARSRPDYPTAGGRCSPLDLQCVKACGVTFAVSAIERVIEERARGDADKAGGNPRHAGGRHRRRHPRA